MHLVIDPDGLIEDREEVVGEKLRDRETVLTNPASMQGTADISTLPFFSVMDIFSYLLTNNISFSALRDYRRSEGYTLMMDGYVQDVSIVTYPHTENTYFAVKAKVKPRTREKDPVSGATFYYPWVIISSVGTDTRSCILSGFCTCKGGIDGCCRHVQATLYEVMDYRGDPTHASVTSGPCLWVRRATANYSAALLTELVTSSGENRRTIVPIQGQYQPVPNVGIIKPVEDFLKVVKECKPDACMLHAWEKQPRNRFFNPLPLSVSSPLHRMDIFLQNHSCDITGCDCAQVFLDTMAYSEDECNLIERETRGQHLNPNWHTMRHGLITASMIKKVLCARDLDSAADALLQPRKMDEENLPPAVQFGRDNEARALTLFTREHRFRHRKCKLSQPGLIVSHTVPFLGASPDAIVTCDHKECGKFLVEVKCLHSLRMLYPKQALKQSIFCEKDESSSYIVKHNHEYYYQMQCQMAVTGIHKCFLCIYTTKGVQSILVPFDEEFWNSAVVKLEQFWKQHLYPKLMLKM